MMAYQVVNPSTHYHMDVEEPLLLDRSRNDAVGANRCWRMLQKPHAKIENDGLGRHVGSIVLPHDSAITVCLT